MAGEVQQKTGRERPPGGRFKEELSQRESVAGDASVPPVCPETPTPARDQGVGQKLQWQWTKFAAWRGWPILLAYAPLASGLAAWALMILLAASGPICGLWFASQGDLKLGATGFCDESGPCTNAVFYEAPALPGDSAWYPRWGLPALLLSHGIVATVAALAASLANLKAGLAYCRKQAQEDDRRQGARDAISHAFARCMTWSLVACIALGVGLFIWTSQSFAEVENGQIMWYCLPVLLALWLFTNGMNDTSQEDYCEDDENGENATDSK